MPRSAATPRRAPIRPTRPWRVACRARPCYCDTTHLTPEASKAMMEDYLNERPSFVLFLASQGQDVTKSPSRLWPDPTSRRAHRRRVLGGHATHDDRASLFAAGRRLAAIPNSSGLLRQGQARRAWGRGLHGGVWIYRPLMRPRLRGNGTGLAPLLSRDEEGIRPVEMKERLQRLMDEYAGGISQFYRTNEERLDYALRHIAVLQSQFRYLRATDSHELMRAMETIDRVDVAEAVVHHLKARKETRWAGWQTRSDYPERDDAPFDCFIESRRDPATGEVSTFTRPYEQIIPGDRHTA